MDNQDRILADCKIIKTLIKPVERNIYGEAKEDEWIKILKSAINNEYRDELIASRIVTNVRMSRATLVIANSISHMNKLAKLVTEYGINPIKGNNLNTLSIPRGTKVVITIYDPSIYVTSNSLPSNIDTVLMTTYTRQPLRLANIIKRLMKNAAKRRRPDIQVQHILDVNFNCIRYMYRLFIEIGSRDIHYITAIES